MEFFKMKLQEKDEHGNELTPAAIGRQMSSKFYLFKFPPNLITRTLEHPAKMTRRSSGFSSGSEPVARPSPALPLANWTASLEQLGRWEGIHRDSELGRIDKWSFPEDKSDEGDEGKSSEAASVEGKGKQVGTKRARSGDSDDEVRNRRIERGREIQEANSAISGMEPYSPPTPPPETGDDDNDRYDDEVDAEGDIDPDVPEALRVKM